MKQDGEYELLGSAQAKSPANAARSHMLLLKIAHISHSDAHVRSE